MLRATTERARNARYRHDGAVDRAVRVALRESLRRITRESLFIRAGLRGGGIQTTCVHPSVTCQGLPDLAGCIVQYIEYIVRTDWDEACH